MRRIRRGNESILALKLHLKHQSSLLRLLGCESSIEAMIWKFKEAWTCNRNKVGSRAIFEERARAEIFQLNNRPPTDPFRRTNVPFGGIFNDIKRRYPHYLSDFKVGSGSHDSLHCELIPIDPILCQDGVNGQALSATVFIYFACLSGAIAFGGLLGEKTRELIGIPETIIVSCVAGRMFSRQGLFHFC